MEPHPWIEGQSAFSASETGKGVESGHACGTGCCECVSVVTAGGRLEFAFCWFMQNPRHAYFEQVQLKNKP